MPRRRQQQGQKKSTSQRQKQLKGKQLKSARGGQRGQACPECGQVNCRCR